MTAKEMIEEMARIIHFDYWGDCYRGSCSDCPINLNGLCKDKEIAEKLYEQGYRKIPEGSVIVSKQIWEEHIEKREKANKIFEERVRKETAREILKELYEQIDERTPKWVEKQIKMKAKQFGVEVEE